MEMPELLSIVFEAVLLFKSLTVLLLFYAFEGAAVVGLQSV